MLADIDDFKGVAKLRMAQLGRDGIDEPVPDPSMYDVTKSSRIRAGLPLRLPPGGQAEHPAPGDLLSGEAVIRSCAVRRRVARVTATRMNAGAHAS